MCLGFFFALHLHIEVVVSGFFSSSYSLCKTIYKIYNRYAMCAFKISSLALVGFGFLSLESSKIIGNAHVVVTNFVGSAIISDGSFFFFCCANDTAFEVKRNERTIESRLKRVFRYHISFSACEANIYLDQKTFPIFKMIVPLFVFFFPSANVFYLWLGVVLP